MSDVLPEVQAMARHLLVRGQRLTCAESCNGGLIAAACTALPGSSDWFDRGFVTYSNEAKTEMLGVDPAVIARAGAVSEEVAAAMAQGALRHAPPAHWALAVTGIAGPGGGTPDKPVGTVWLAWAGPQGLLRTRREVFSGDRATVREQTCVAALEGLLALLDPMLSNRTP